MLSNPDTSHTKKPGLFTPTSALVAGRKVYQIPPSARSGWRLEMRDRVAQLSVQWRKRGYELHFGVGIAQGYATIGAIGFEGRRDYGAIGSVTTLAARLCGEVRPGQILISQRLMAAVEDLMQAEPVGNLHLKGFLKPV